MPKKIATAKNNKMPICRIMESRDAFQALSKIEKAPHVSLKIALFVVHQIEPILKIIEDQRNALIRKFNTSSENETASIDPSKNKQSHENFVKEFGDYLATEHDCGKIDLTIHELVDSISKGDGKISEATLMGLMPFLKPDC